MPRLFPILALNQYLLILLTLAAGMTTDSVALPATPPVAADPQAQELDRRLNQDITPLLSKYCIECHRGEAPKGDIHLDTMTGLSEALDMAGDIRTLREMVSTGEMPPRKKLQPTEHERLIITQWADALLDYVPTDAPIDPGWFTIHRLNRTEYRNTLRDLLGIDPHSTDVAAKLPRDDTGYGFDNIADVLSTSPLAVEQYLDAAEHAIDLAFGPPIDFGDHPKTLRPLEGTKSGQPLPLGGYFLYSNGAASARYTFPATGEYIIRMRTWETPAGDEHALVSLRIDEQQVREFYVDGTREDPEDLEFHVRLEQGSHRISAYFTNDYYVPKVGDRNLGVGSISIAGPLDESTTARPAAFAQLLAPAADLHDDTARAHAVLTAYASRVYRRPATDTQVRALLKVYESQREAGQSFEPAIRTACAAALVSPNFLFRSVANPAASDPNSRYTLDGYELASRLSYFLWSSMPDEPLLAAAANGALLTDDGLARQVRRMLDDPRSAAFVENFSGQWLQVRSLEALAIDRARFPDYSDQLRADMTSEATLFFADVLHSGGSVLAFLDSDYTFLNTRLARYYQIPGVKGEQFRRVTLPPDSQRGGVLTMGALLTVTSNTTRTSPVKRGLFVLDQILGTPPPPPPPDVPPLEQSSKTGEHPTLREQLAAHVANPTCAVCHNRMDPLGLAFENFDAIGHWREQDNGKPIDASGTLPGGIAIHGPKDLKRILMDRSDQFIETLTAKVLTYSIGRGAESFDRPAIRRIATATRAHGDRFSALIEEVVLSDTFRTCRGRGKSHD